MRVFSFIALVVLLAGTGTLASAKDIALVSNKTNALSGITMPDLLKACKGQINHWPDGKPVTCIIRNPESPDMRIVLEKLYSLTKPELMTMVTAANHGRSSHPAIVLVGSDDALVKRVESTPGSVGLVDVYSITGGVNVVKIGGKLPLEPGYPLHGN